MSGHSKWSNIKHKKAKNDAVRGRVWSKVARAIMVAAKNGGGDPDGNLALRYAIDEAKAVNMPKDTIEKAIKKGTGELGSAHFERILYEGYGPGGVAILVDCLTDNRARTAPEMRKIFERSGGTLGATNCVAYLFEQKGRIAVEKSKVEEDRLMEVALDAGADDITSDEDLYEITCTPHAMTAVKEALAAARIEPAHAEIAMVASNSVMPEADKARQVMHLLEGLEECDDTQHVYSNFEIPDELAAEM